MTLKDLLGIWEYRAVNGSVRRKYYSVTPQADNFFLIGKYAVTTSTDHPSTGNLRTTVIVDNASAFRRLLAKQAGGYTLIEPYTGTCDASADLTEEELRAIPKKRVKKSSALADWLLS